MSSSSCNNNNSRNTRYPAIAMQLYLDTDIRRQCLQISNGNNKKTIRKSSMSMLSGWGGCAKSPEGAAYQHQARAGGYNWFPRSASMGMGSDSISVARTKQRSISAKERPTGKTGKYSGLTTSQKVEIVINDDIQWLKLQQSLREADGLWTSVGVQQVIDWHVQQRIDEMERLELALSEQNGPPPNDLSENSAAVAIKEEVGVVSVVKKFARRASLATQNYLVNQNKNGNPSTSGNK